MKIEEPNESHNHCLHPHKGPIHMVVPPGKTVRQCCKCKDIVLVHSENYGLRW